MKIVVLKGSKPWDIKMTGTTAGKEKDIEFGKTHVSVSGKLFVSEFCYIVCTGHSAWVVDELKGKFLQRLFLMIDTVVANKMNHKRVGIVFLILHEPSHPSDYPVISDSAI